MSTEIGTIHHTGLRDQELQITQFSGGKLGLMLQISQGLAGVLPPKIVGGKPEHEPGSGCIQLTRTDVVLLVEMLDGWLYKVEDPDDK